MTYRLYIADNQPMKFVTMRVSADTRKNIQEVSKRTGVKLWFAMAKAASDLLRRVKANEK